MKKNLVVLVIVLILIGAFFVGRTHLGRKGEEKVLLLSGNMEVTETDIAFKIPGRVTALLTDEGQSVQKGALLARLDREEPASVVAQNKAALEEAETRL